MAPLTSMTAPGSVGPGGVGDQYRFGEACLEIDDGGGVACPVGYELDCRAHGEHAVGDDAGQAHAGGEGFVPVDRVEVAGRAGVLDQVLRADVMLRLPMSWPTASS